jgi:hypothetical protein
MGAICDASTILRVVGSVRSCVCAGAWLLVVLVTLSEEQSMGAWSVGLASSSSANGANGLLLLVTCWCTNWMAQIRAQEVVLISVDTNMQGLGCC